MPKIKTRSEIKDIYKWDLSTIYQSIDDFYCDYELCSNLIKEFPKHKDIMLNGPEELFSLLKDLEKLDELLSKLYSYAHLKKDEDLSNNTFIELMGKVENLGDLYKKATYFVIPNYLKMDYSTIDKWLSDNDYLSKYRRMFEMVFRFKTHTLSEDEEKLISNISKAFDDSYQAYVTLSNSDMTFPIIRDEKNKRVELTDTNFSIYRQSKDRRVRQDAFNSLYQTYKQFSNTIAFNLRKSVESNMAFAKLKNYSSSIEASVFEDEVPISVYNNLIEVVNNNVGVLYKYYNLCKKVLKLDEYHLYDIYAPLVDDNDRKINFNEAKDIIFNALSVLGSEYTDILKKAFKEKWIDIYPNVGKRGGAYSSGNYYTKPFILLNYQDRLDDVSTLAHELGHSIHSYYTFKNNDPEYATYSIFVAEVASTVNELLLDNYLIKNAKSRKEKLIILDQLMEKFKGTIYRQTMFAEFEKLIYEKAESDEILTAELLSSEYYELNKKYFGPDVVVDDNIRYEWARIPHFYYDFYVYKYATGLSAACHIVNDILSGKENAVKDYIEFLKQGLRKTPLEELKIAGVDLSGKEVIESALLMFNNTIDEFNKTYEEYLRSGDGVNE